ncbi:HD domain-containing protein [Christensenellaceae bacterium OttesenSCG-928-K19]|nr:HD domain-containing protein [Christensenellaceae bacterium OttesenSCG-928-K19]
MASIDSSAAIQIIRRALGGIDTELVSHGDRVAYILYKMLAYQGKYSKDEMQKIFVLAILHDIGAYKTDEPGVLLKFEYAQVWPHSVYGYFYLKYLSPYKDLARVLLYHHLDYDKSKRIKYQHMDIAAMLNVADKVELLLRSGKEGAGRLKTHSGTKYSPNALQVFHYADGKYRILDHLKDGSYLSENDTIISDINWSKGGCKQILQLLVYAIDFKNEETALRNISTNNIAQYLGENLGLTPDELESLQFAALTYDLGMLGIPSDILNAPRKLTDEEQKTVREHIQATGEILQDLVSEDIYNIAMRHHERTDGSGYPEGLQGTSLTLPERILAVADTIAAMGTRKSYRAPMQKNEVLQVLQKEIDVGRLCPEVTGYAIQNYDDMKATAGIRNAEVMEYYLAIKDQFGTIIQEFEKHDQ